MNIYKSTTKKTDRQVMQTPPGIAEWCAEEYGCTIDLAANPRNKKFYNYRSDITPTTDEDSAGWMGNAFGQNWGCAGDAVGFCNPPYEDLAPWLIRAIDEANQKFASVFLIPTFNGDRWGHLAFQATEIIFIQGRINFIKESDGLPLKGNGRGSMLCVFSPFQGLTPAFSYITLEEIYGTRNK